MSRKKSHEFPAAMMDICQYQRFFPLQTFQQACQCMILIPIDFEVCIFFFLLSCNVRKESGRQAIVEDFKEKRD